jgi:HK97 gp10 family phage protein
MPENGVKVVGLNKVVRNLSKLGTDSEDLKDAFQKVGQHGVRQAKLAAPAESGTMKASIRASRRKNSSYIRMGNARAFYARFVEYGTIYQRPQRILRGVVEREGRWAVQTIERELNKLIARAGFDA